MFRQKANFLDGPIIIFLVIFRIQTNFTPERCIYFYLQASFLKFSLFYFFSSGFFFFLVIEEAGIFDLQDLSYVIPCIPLFADFPFFLGVLHYILVFLKFPVNWKFDLDWKLDQIVWQEYISWCYVLPTAPHRGEARVLSCFFVCVTEIDPWIQVVSA